MNNDVQPASQASWFARYLMPGLVFEAVVIGGGYATGRELVEFFLSRGPLSGLLGMLTTLCVWGLVLAATFEFARATRSFDYQTFFNRLLGRGAILFEVAYFFLILVVLSVLGAAAGELFKNSFGLPAIAGPLALMALIAFFVYFGSSVVERALSFWALLLYAVFIGLIIWCLTHYGATISHSLAAPQSTSGWFTAGIVYAGYNLASAPSVIFCIRHLTRRREAVIAGLVGGALATVPGILFFLSMLAFYPGITKEPVPSVYLLTQVGSHSFQLFFEIVLFGTLVKTGIGLLHAVNERLAVRLAARAVTMQRKHRSAVSVAVLLTALVLADRIGIVELIAKGYGTLTYAFIAIYVIPVLTIGVWKARRLTVQPREFQGG